MSERAEKPDGPEIAAQPESATMPVVREVFDDTSRARAHRSIDALLASVPRLVPLQPTEDCDCETCEALRASRPLVREVQ